MIKINITLAPYLLVLLFFTTLSFNIRAQDGVFDDLLILYVDEDHEKCLTKAHGYADKEKTRREPLPYLYLSICNYEMSKMEKYTTDPEWKRVGSNALKNAEKFHKKDKELEYFYNYSTFITMRIIGAN